MIIGMNMMLRSLYLEEIGKLKDISVSPKNGYDSGNGS